MVQANDLRIGNFIIDPEFLLIPSTVNEIQNDGFIVTNYNDHLTNVKAEPIPLTAEILDKINWNGYIKFNIGSYFKIDDVGHLYYRSDYSGVNINYLHQLQNFYYLLIGVELEIVW